MTEIPVSRQHDELVADAELGEQRIDGSHLYAAATAFVAQAGRGDVIAARRHDHGHVREALDELCPGARTVKTLQQFLKHQSSRVNRAPEESFPEAPHLGNLRR